MKEGCLELKKKGRSPGWKTGLFGLGVLMPSAAFVEELTTRALHPWGRNEVLALQAFGVGLDLFKQP